MGSSLLREVRQTDIVNGNVKCIRGAKVSDVKDDLKSLSTTPKSIVTYVGGNDLMSENMTVDSVCEEYGILLTEAKKKFPDANLYVAGLVPRKKNDTVRTKIKHFNQSSKAWCSANGIAFLENEDCFELKSGHVDVSCYSMDEETPAVHLNRRGTIRLLENIEKNVPDIKLSTNLSDSVKSPMMQPMNYAKAVTHGQVIHRHERLQRNNLRSHDRQNGSNGNAHFSYRRGCYNCGETNYKRSNCKYEDKLRCRSCQILGHKEKFCRVQKL